MAIKIIKEPTIRRYKATCPICGCEFEFDTTDARWYIRTDDPLMNTRTKTDCIISCPCCQTDLENKQTEIK